MKPWICLIMILSVCLAGCQNPEYSQQMSGSNRGNRVEYKYKTFSSAEYNHLQAESGWVIFVDYATKVTKGTLSMEIRDPAENLLWNIELTSDATDHVELPANLDGEYVLQITGQKTGGEFSVQWGIVEGMFSDPPAPPWMPVQVAELNLNFQAPRGWESPTGRIWVSPDDSSSLVGFQWRWVNPPAMPEAVFLPANAQMRDSGELDLGWASGRWYEIDVYYPPQEGEVNAQIQTHERHLVLLYNVNDQRLGVDFYARANRLERLAALSDIVEYMAESASLSE
jgi:hypothetical protein